MTEEPFASRRELDLLKLSVEALRQDVEHGFEAHRLAHEAEEKARVSGRRWLIGAVIAAVAAVDAPLVTLLLTRGR